VRKTLLFGTFALVAAFLLSSRAAYTFAASEGDEPMSPRLSALKKQIAEGKRETLESFWQDVKKQGAPIIEPIAGDTQNYFVTFLFQAKDEIRNVLVMGGVAGFEIPENMMSRLLDTDLWYKTYKVRSDARFSYNLSVNDSMIPFGKVDFTDPKVAMQRISTFKTDPLNSNTYLGSPPSSVVELPNAIPQPWIKRSSKVPAGELVSKKIKSAILNNERTAWVYTPPGYKKDGPPYPLMVLFDGVAYTLLVPTPVILDNMLERGLIQPVVAIVLENPTQTSRNKELPCNPSFADFLAKEVVPWMRANYHVTSDAAQTYVGGSSYGGLAATYAGFHNPETFGNVISQSGSFWWKPDGDSEHEWLTRQFAESDKLPVRFYLDVGLLESGPTPDNGPSQVVVNRHMRDILKAKGYFVHYREFNGGHEYLNWRGTFSDALTVLMGSQLNKQK